MVEIIAGPNVIKGVLKNYEFTEDGGDINLLVRLELAGTSYVECVFPKITPVLRKAILNLKMENLKDSSIDLRKQSVSINKIVEGGNAGSPKKKPGAGLPKGKIGSTFLG